MGILFKSVKELSDYIADARLNGSAIIWTNGCFDIIHVGHAMVLSEAKKLSENTRLIVGVNSDDSVRRIKGNKRPIVPEHDRAMLLTYFSSVDVVFIFNEDTPMEMLKIVKPDIMVKGAAWDGKDAIGDFVRSYGGVIHLVPIHNSPTSATTNIINKILATNSGGSIKGYPFLSSTC